MHCEMPCLRTWNNPINLILLVIFIFLSSHPVLAERESALRGVVRIQVSKSSSYSGTGVLINRRGWILTSLEALLHHPEIRARYESQLIRAPQPKGRTSVVLGEVFRLKEEKAFRTPFVLEEVDGVSLSIPHFLSRKVEVLFLGRSFYRSLEEASSVPLPWNLRWRYHQAQFRLNQNAYALIRVVLDEGEETDCLPFLSKEDQALESARFVGFPQSSRLPFSAISHSAQVIDDFLVGYYENSTATQEWQSAGETGFDLYSWLSTRMDYGFARKGLEGAPLLTSEKGEVTGIYLFESAALENKTPVFTQHAIKSVQLRTQLQDFFPDAFVCRRGETSSQVEWIRSPDKQPAMTHFEFYSSKAASALLKIFSERDTPTRQLVFEIAQKSASFVLEEQETVPLVYHEDLMDKLLSQMTRKTPEGKTQLEAELTVQLMSFGVRLDDIPPVERRRWLQEWVVRSISRFIGYFYLNEVAIRRYEKGQMTAEEIQKALKPLALPLSKEFLQRAQKKRSDFLSESQLQIMLDSLINLQ